MPFSTVGDKKVGQGCFLFYSALIAPFYDLFHGGIVIRSLYGLDIVLAVILLGRFPLDEDHAPGHGVGTLDVGVVETFYLHGQAVQVQLLLYLFQQAHGPLLRIQLFGLLQAVGFVLLHIEDGEFQQLLFVSPLRDGKDDIFQLHIQLKRHDDFTRKALVSFPHFDDAEREQFFFALIQSFLVFKGESLVDGTVRNVQVVDESGLFIAVFFDGEHVDIVQHVAYHFRFCPVVFQQQVFFLYLLCFFKLHFGCQFLHLLEKHPFYLLGIPFEYFLDFSDVFQILFLALLPDARSCTVLDVVFQANIELSGTYVFRREVQVACTQRVQMLDEVE